MVINGDTVTIDMAPLAELSAARNFATEHPTLPLPETAQRNSSSLLLQNQADGPHGRTIAVHSNLVDRSSGGEKADLACEVCIVIVVIGQQREIGYLAAGVGGFCISCGFFFHCFSQSSSEGTVTGACFE